MKQFLDKDFLLNTNTAKTLFQSVAGLPIIDRQSNLSAEEIATNKTFKNITDLWLSDNKRQALMRRYGIDEFYITGEAGDYEKFQKWAEVVPSLFGSTLYHETHLELQRFFGIYEPLSPATAERIWNRTSALIASEKFCAYELFKKFNVQLICTPVDAADTLVWHQKIAEEGTCPVKVLPVFSAEKALDIGSDAFPQWIAAMEDACSKEIKDYYSLQSCLVERLLFFKAIGCKTAIQNVSIQLSTDISFEQADEIFKKAREQKQLSSQEIACYRAHLFGFLLTKYADYQVCAQVVIDDASIGSDTITFFENFSEKHVLPKLVLLPKKAADLAAIAKAADTCKISANLLYGCSDDMAYCKSDIQLLLGQIAAQGLLPKLIGFSTNSNSFLSYPSHEYFRRVVCDYLGEKVEKGEYPNYPELLKKFATDISYTNAKQMMEY